MSLQAALHHPSEKALFKASAILSALLWLLLSVAALIYGPFIALGVFLVHGLFIAMIRGNGVQVSEQQFPHIHHLVVEASQKLGLSKVPEVYVMQSGGALNAFATKFLSRRFIVLYSDLVDQCASPKQLQFIIGHEVGHLVAGHLQWNLFLLPSKLIPWLGTAYARACEFTCDRCGHYAVDSLDDSRRALMVLASGGKLASQAKPEAFAAQQAYAGTFFGTAAEVGGTYPFLSSRVAALDNFAAPGTHGPVARNAAGVFFAPFIGGAMNGGANFLVPMFVIGILAAVAIPNFVKYQQLAKQKAAASAQQSPGNRATDSASNSEAGASPEQAQAEEPLPAAEVVFQTKGKNTHALKQELLDQAPAINAALAKAEAGQFETVRCDARTCVVYAPDVAPQAFSQALRPLLDTWKPKAAKPQVTALLRYPDGQTENLQP